MPRSRFRQKRKPTDITSKPYTIVIAGGGAAGFFSAITCAERISDCRIVVLERSPDVLAKVLISGGGRCNVTNACFEPKELVKNYPRGYRELLGPFHSWQPRDTVKWFEERGVTLKAEPDNRMFPVSNKSSSIANCLIHEAEQAGVTVQTNVGLVSAQREEQGFLLGLSDGTEMRCNELLIATGGNKNSGVFKIVESLGHTIKPLRPSLFSFNCDDPRLKSLPGISAADVEVTVAGTKLKQRGPILITHWGMSGPAVLKLSAWGAVELANREYRFAVRVNWAPGMTDQMVRDQVQDCRIDHGKKQILSWNPWGLPQRLWQALVAGIGVDSNSIWNQFPKQSVDQLVETLLRSEFNIDGKSMNKDEFVTCGGISLKEIDFKTMGSKVCKGLYFAGEVLDIDGVTGGFNFQAAWTTGRIAGTSIGQEM